MRWRAILLILLAAFCHQGPTVQAQSSSNPSAASLFEWQDSSGQYTTRARFIVLAGETVTLEKEDGTRVEIPLSRLRADHAQRARDLETFADGKMEEKYVAEAPVREERQKEEARERFSEYMKVRLGVTGTPGEVRTRLEAIETPGKTTAWPYVKSLYTHVDAPVEWGADLFKFYKKLTTLLSDDYKTDYLFPLIMIINVLIGVVIMIWWLKILLSDGCGWGCAYFIPIINVGVIIYYLFARWEDVKKPFFLGVFSWLLNFAAYLFVPSWAPEVAALELWLLTTQP